MLQLTVTGRVTVLLALGLSMVNRSSTRNASPWATQPDVRATAQRRSPLRPAPPSAAQHSSGPAKHASSLSGRSHRLVVRTEPGRQPSVVTTKAGEGLLGMGRRD